MTVSISSVRARSGGDEFEIVFEIVSDDGQNRNKQSFIISARQYLTLCPQKGVSSEEEYQTLECEADVWSAVQRGMSCLSYGACSARALQRKLVLKGAEPTVARLAVEQLISLGALDASDDAYRIAQKLVAKLWGERRIVSELYKKGYERDAVLSAVERLRDDGVDYSKMCRELVRRRYCDKVSDPDERKKVYAACVRYGYTPSEIRDAMLYFKNQ